MIRSSLFLFRVICNSWINTLSWLSISNPFKTKQSAMKSTATASLYFSPQAQQEKKEAASLKPNLSPYLKAILSGATRLVNSGSHAAMENPDRDAAIRYIKESALMRK